ncbi:MAG: TIGR04076 family protein [Bilophila wadsworthia]
MKRCRITVLKRHFDEELAKEYGSKGIGKCPMLKEGQIFYADYAKPDGFCDEAWKAIYQYVFALAHGSGQFYYGDWIEKPGVAICSCNDGLRPVIFKVERTDEEAAINYPRITIRREESFSSPSPNPTLSSSKTFVFIESLFTAFPAQIAIRRIIFQRGTALTTHFQNK